MNLNTIKPAPGAKTPAKRLGRGIGSVKERLAVARHIKVNMRARVFP